MAACSSSNCRVMVALLTRLHRAMANQVCLANIGNIISLYMHHLSHQVQSNLGAPVVWARFWPVTLTFLLSCRRSRLLLLAVPWLTSG